MTMETGGPLDDGGILPLPDPMDLFHSWMKEAEASEPGDPNAMALATADADGAPNVRMVLLKGADAGGFVSIPTPAASRAARSPPIRAPR